MFYLNILSYQTKRVKSASNFAMTVKDIIEKADIIDKDKSFTDYKEVVYGICY